MMDRRKLEVIEVDWDDTAAYHGWKPEELVKVNVEPSFCRSVGYLLENSKAQLVLYQSMADNENVSEVLVIPKSAVRKIRKLK